MWKEKLQGGIIFRHISVCNDSIAALTIFEPLTFPYISPREFHVGQFTQPLRSLTPIEL